MDIKVFMTKECDYIPDGIEIYNDVTDLTYDAITGLTFMANCYTFPVSRKKYHFAPNEIKFFKTGDKLSYRKKLTLVRINTSDGDSWRYSKSDHLWWLFNSKGKKCRIAFNLDTLEKYYIKVNHFTVR